MTIESRVYLVELRSKYGWGGTTYRRTRKQEAFSLAKHLRTTPPYNARPNWVRVVKKETTSEVIG